MYPPFVVWWGLRSALPRSGFDNWLTVSLSAGEQFVGQVLGGGAVVGVRRIALLEQDDPPCRTVAAVPSQTRT